MFGNLIAMGLEYLKLLLETEDQKKGDKEAMSYKFEQLYQYVDKGLLENEQIRCNFQ